MNIPNAISYRHNAPSEVDPGNRLPFHLVKTKAFTVQKYPPKRMPRKGTVWLRGRCDVMTDFLHYNK